MKIIWSPTAKTKIKEIDRLSEAELKKLFHFAFLASLFCLSCKSSVDSLSDDNLSITTEQTAVILTNNSNQVVHYILLEYEISTWIDLDPNVEWPTIEANSKVTIPYSEIMGYQESSNEAFIMWRLGERSSSNSLTFR